LLQYSIKLRCVYFDINDLMDLICFYMWPIIKDQTYFLQYSDQILDTKHVLHKAYDQLLHNVLKIFPFIVRSITLNQKIQ
jgi:hypothetical protein